MAPQDRARPGARDLTCGSGGSGVGSLTGHDHHLTMEFNDRTNTHIHDTTHLNLRTGKILRRRGLTAAGTGGTVSRRAFRCRTAG